MYNKDIILVNNKIKLNPARRHRDLQTFTFIHGDYAFVHFGKYALVFFNSANVAIFNYISYKDYIIDEFESTFIRWLTPLELMTGAFILDNITYKYDYNNDILKCNSL